MERIEALTQFKANGVKTTPTYSTLVHPTFVKLLISSEMLVPVKFMLPKELVNQLQKSQGQSMPKSTTFTITLSEEGYKVIPVLSSKVQNLKSENRSKTNKNKTEEFVPRIFGQRTPSQLFQVSKIVRRQNQLDYGHNKNNSSRFVPSLFGQRTPSQLFLLSKSSKSSKYSRAHKAQKSKKTFKKAVSLKQRIQRNIPIYGTTGQNGYLTSSRLINPLRIKRERYYTLGKGRLTPSALHLAYSKEHKFRPSLFGALTASQILNASRRQANRTNNDQQFELISGGPTVSQLGLNRRSSKSKVKPVEPSSKFLKHLNQLPMEKSKKTDDPLIGLTSSQLLLLSNGGKIQQVKKGKQPKKTPQSYFKKASQQKAEKETTRLIPFLFGF